MGAKHLPDNIASRFLLLYVLPFSYGAATRVPFVFASLHCVLMLGTSLPTLAGVLGCYQVRCCTPPSFPMRTVPLFPAAFWFCCRRACPPQHNPSTTPAQPQHRHNSTLHWYVFCCRGPMSVPIDQYLHKIKPCPGLDQHHRTMTGPLPASPSPLAHAGVPYPWQLLCGCPGAPGGPAMWGSSWTVGLRHHGGSNGSGPLSSGARGHRCLPGTGGAL